MKNQDEMKAVKSDLFFWLCLLLLSTGGMSSLTVVPWAWLRAVIRLIFVGSIFELGHSVSQYLKIKRNKGE